MKEMQLTENFKLSEFVKSATADKYNIDNTPSATHIKNLKNLCVNCLQPVRTQYGKPIIVNNGFRSPALNEAMKKDGYKVSENSQHLLGEAADIRDMDKTKNKALFDTIFNFGVFDQLIWECGTDKYPDWIHVSLKKSKNRKEVLRINSNGVTTHRKYELMWTL